MNDSIIRRTAMSPPPATTVFDLPGVSFSWDTQTRTNNGEPLFKVQTDIGAQPAASMLLEIG